MLIQAIGVSLPAAMAIALSPFPVIGVVLLVGGRHGVRGGSAFALGWIAGLSVVVCLTVLAFSGADDPDSTSSAVADWSRVVVGASLMVLGVRKWLRRPRPGDDVEVPGWITSLDEMSPTRALIVGATVSAANPKHFILAASAATAVIEVGVHEVDLFTAAAAFVLLSSWTVIAAILVHVAGGERGAAVLDRVRRFMVDNSEVIVVLVLLILGANVLGGGLEGLGR